jgi:hypothetical protein
MLVTFVFQMSRASYQALVIGLQMKCFTRYYYRKLGWHEMHHLNFKLVMNLETYGPGDRVLDTYP